MKKTFLFSLTFAVALGTHAQQKLPFQDTSLPTEQRVEDLLQRLTLEEKAKLMMNRSPEDVSSKGMAYMRAR